jgi:hypothetical protein
MVLIPNAGHFAAFVQPQRFLHELVTRVRPQALNAEVPSHRMLVEL